ncbi:MAG TPA: heavy metal-binding domain-containing protein [Roseiarcus sp.]|nr:heavy metal-binding domain-containing protein [Roseiarcus sp.]
MQVSFAAALDDGRRTIAIGRIRATGPWRAAGGAGAEADRQAAIEALRREAEDYGADGVVEVQFDVEGCKGCGIDGLRLERVTATGLAVRFAAAA